MNFGNQTDSAGLIGNVQKPLFSRRNPSQITIQQLQVNFNHLCVDNLLPAVSRTETFIGARGMITTLFKYCIQGNFDWFDLCDHPRFLVFLFRRVNISIEVMFCVVVAMCEFIRVSFGAVCC